MAYRGKRKKSISPWALGAVLLALLGAALYFIPMTGMKFSGLLMMCGGAFMLLLMALHRLSEERRWALWMKRVLLAAFVLGFALFSVMEIWVLSKDETDLTRDVNAVIVLGAGVNGYAPSLTLQTRLEATVDYIADKPDVPIVVTGGQGNGELITEARCMADWLIAKGISEERIVLEEQARNTRENIDFSLALLHEMGIDTTSNIAVVSNDYHLARAAYLWGPPNMVPVAAHMPAIFWPLTVNYYVREAFGMAEAVLLG